ncbi:MAG: alanine racemase [Anaerolineaceae bacterium]|nr:alanine racemase [Anaerolineaceae bacterium]
MFLKNLIKRNKSFVEDVINLHQAGKIPANSYVLDLDTMQKNASIMVDEAKKHNLKIYAMSKQFGRNPEAFKALAVGGIDSYVAVDMNCARPIQKAGCKVGHIGHLVQVARAEAETAAKMTPDYWTVFSNEKAVEASKASKSIGTTQQLLARIYSSGDTFYTGHEGGFRAEDIVSIAEYFDQLSNAAFAGITTFPALLFNSETNKISPTSNLRTLEKAAEALAASGRNNIEVNAPGTTSSIMMEALAAAGSTQVEPGHGLTGTTPLHAVSELPEDPAILYLSEISHFHNGKPYCFGGGMYIDPVFPPYDVKALVGSDPETALINPVSVSIPQPAAIDYYGIIEPDLQNSIHSGDSVIFGFRVQAFVTRAYIVPISGLSIGKPVVKHIWNSHGQKVAWPEW